MRSGLCFWAEAKATTRNIIRAIFKPLSDRTEVSMMSSPRPPASISGCVGAVNVDVLWTAGGKSSVVMASRNSTR